MSGEERGQRRRRNVQRVRSDSGAHVDEADAEMMLSQEVQEQSKSRTSNDCGCSLSL